MRHKGLLILFSSLFLTYFLVAIFFFSSFGKEKTAQIFKVAAAFVTNQPKIESKLTSLQATTQINKEIGIDSINNTSKYGVCGTDLGSMFEWSGRTYMAFGDTFGCPLETQTNWRSNSLAYTTDTNPSDGLKFDNWITDETGQAKELFHPGPGIKSAIPTGGISANNTGYLFYMNVRDWGQPGKWICSSSSIATSSDLGQNWKKEEDTISWSSGNFNQVSLFKENSFVYILGTPCGRWGNVKLARVRESEILNKTSYEYFTGLDNNQNSLWSGQENEAKAVLSGPVGEISVRWNIWLNKFIISYLDESSGNLILRTSNEPWGSWEKPFVLASSKDYPQLYVAFMHPSYSENYGETIYFRMSQFFPTYSTFWMKTKLVKEALPTNTKPITSSTLNYVYWVHAKSEFESSCCTNNPSTKTTDSSHSFTLKGDLDPKGYEGVVCSPDCNGRVIWAGTVQFDSNRKLTLSPQGQI